MLDSKTHAIVDELLPLIRSFTSCEYGIAVGGAHAKGVADSESDLDIYLFTRGALKNSERESLTVRYSSKISDIVTWGNEEPFDQGGSDFYFDKTKIECWLRNSDNISNSVSECKEGIVKQELVRWTTTGFYNHCCLSDLKHMIPIEDPCEILLKWQTDIREYPPKLREAIIQKHLSGARFWPNNFHYKSAVERQDIVYTTGIIQQVIHNLIQVLFAVNRAYFPGDKKLEQALGKLDILPERFIERMITLIFPAEKASVETLRAQQHNLQQLLKDVEIIVYEALST